MKQEASCASSRRGPHQLSAPARPTDATLVGMPHRGKGAELLSVLSAATDKPLVILLNGHPDPDAIGSALAHKRICDHLGVSATIAHALPLSRSENRALVKLLDIPLTRILDSA